MRRAFILTTLMLLTVGCAASDEPSVEEARYVFEHSKIEPICAGNTLTVGLTLEKLYDTNDPVSHTRVLEDAKACGGSGTVPDSEATEMPEEEPQVETEVDAATRTQTPSQPASVDSSSQLHIHCSKPRCMVILEGVE